MSLREELGFIASLRLVSNCLIARGHERPAIRVTRIEPTKFPPMTMTQQHRKPVQKSTTSDVATFLDPKTMRGLSEYWIPALIIAPVETPPSLAILEFCGDAATFGALAQAHIASRALMSQQLIWRALYIARWPRVLGFIGQKWRQAYHDRDARFLRVLGWRRMWERA